MSTINHIDGEHIKRLKPLELIRLLRILLFCEARSRQLCASGIHVPLDITVADGGEDGRWKAQITPSDYIPNGFTVYQSKAQELGPAECAREVLHPADGKKYLQATVKPKVAEVLDAGGCYCFFCSHPYNQKLIGERISEVRNALKEGGRTTWETDQVVFLDGDKIANWCNDHVAAQVHVCECCKLAQNVTLMTFGTWARLLHKRIPYKLNDCLRNHIKTLRDHLATPSAIARIIGLSGLGKTRLAFEALRPVDIAGSPTNFALSDSAVYVDLARFTVDKLESIQQLAIGGYSGIIVADNCSLPWHNELSQMAKMEGSKLSLLTLDYTPEQMTSDCLYITLDPDSLAPLIPEILKDIPSLRALKEQQVSHLAHFAQGFPQIACLLAESREPLSYDLLNRSQLADRLLWGRAAPDEKSRKLARALCLFLHVGVSGKVEAQKQFVCQSLCGGMSDREFRERCKPFRDRRIIQDVGDYIMVGPAPLAVTLAADWWQHSSARELQLLLPEIEGVGLMESFCRQLRHLNFSEKVVQVTQELCGNTGPFAQAEVLFSESGSRLFRALVELNPTAALHALNHVFDKKSQEELKANVSSRRNLVWALEKLCWGSIEFLAAAPLLLRLAAAENEHCSNNATGQFVQLFQLYLSGTQQPALRRLDIVKTGLTGGDPAIRSVCIQALCVALRPHTGHYSRMGGVERKGLNLPEEDWRPTTHRDIAEYQLRAFKMLKQTVLSDKELTAFASAELGRHMGGILSPPYLEKIEPDVKELTAFLKGFWPEGRASITTALQYHGAGYPPEAIMRLQTWIDWLTPQELPLQLKQVVTKPGHCVRAEADGRYTDVAAEKAKDLGKQLGSQQADLMPCLPDLLRGNQEKALDFGEGLAVTHPAPADFINTCLENLRATPKDCRNIALLGGFLRGMKNQDLAARALQTVAADPELVDLLIRLICTRQVQKSDLELAVKLVEEGKIPPRQLNLFMYGSVTDVLEANEIVGILMPLVDRQPGALIPVYEILSMYTFNAPDRWAVCQSAVKDLVQRRDFLVSLQPTMDLHFWEEHCHGFLNSGDGAFAINQLQQIMQVQEACGFDMSGGHERHRILADIFRVHGDKCWPIFGQAVLSEKWFLFDDLIRAHDLYVPKAHEDTFSCSLWSLKPEVLIPWCRAYPEAVPHLLEVMGLFTTNNDGTLDWHPLALALLDACFTEPYTGAIHANLFSYGSVGSRVPYIERRIALLRKLETHAKPDVRELAANMISAFEEDKKGEVKQDQEFKAGII